MALHIYPNSSYSRRGDDSGVKDEDRLREFNWCHNFKGKGPGDGKFCSPEGGGGSSASGVTSGMTAKQARDLAMAAQKGGGPSGGVPKPGQPFGKRVPVSKADINALTAIADDQTIPKQDRDARMMAILHARYPELVAEAEKMVQRGAAAQPHFTRLLQGIAEHGGYTVHGNMGAAEIFEGTTEYALVGPLKSLTRAALKTATDNEGDITKLTDVVRGSLVVNSAQDVVAALRHLDSVAEIAHIKDNTNHPLSTNYRDLNVLIRLPNGVLAEVQIITKRMAKAKGPLGGHLLYEDWRVLPDNSPQATLRHAQMEALYGAAWGHQSAAALAQLAQDVTKIRKRVALRTRTAAPSPAARLHLPHPMRLPLR